MRLCFTQPAKWAVLVFVSVLLAVPALPAAAESTAPTPTTTPPGAVTIGNGLSFTSAVITAPGQPTRTMSAYQAAVYVQSWFADAFYGKPTIEPLPAGLTVYRVDITGTWFGGTGTVTTYYAQDGGTPYVSVPDHEPISQGPPADPPPPTKWWSPLDRVVDAFNGTAKLVDTGGTYAATTSTTAAAASTGTTGSSSKAWIVAVVGGVVVLMLAATLIRRRRRDEHRRSEVSEPV